MNQREAAADLCEQLHEDDTAPDLTTVDLLDAMASLGFILQKGGGAAEAYAEAVIEASA